MLGDVTQFVSLARDGAYMYGDRRVSRTERTKWRVTFRNLAIQAHSALHAEDTAPAEQAMEQLIDLACEVRNVQYFHSEDPVEAAKFVVSHAAAAAGKGSRRGRSSSLGGRSEADHRRSDRARTLSAWHAMLAEHLAGPD
jgi:hypothetical protein